MRKITAIILFIIIVALVAGCGQANYANIKVNSYQEIEDPYSEYINPEYKNPTDTGDKGLIIDVEVENLTDNTLFIELEFLENYGQKYIWFILIDGEGKEYEQSILLAGSLLELPEPYIGSFINPRTKAVGIIAFEVPDTWAFFTLEVRQNSEGEGSPKIIYTQEITKENVSR